MPAAARGVLDNAAGSARLEGVTISDDHRRIAAAFPAGEIDDAEYRANALKLTLEELDPDS